MTAYAAFRLGMRVHIMEKSAGSPAGQIAHKEVVGDLSDHALLVRFASECDVVTLESEFLDEADLLEIERAGHRLYPRSHSVAQIQDKLVQKQTVEAAGVPVAPFRRAPSPDEAAAFGHEHGYPFLLKKRRGSYDGYGNATVRSPEELAAAWETLSPAASPQDLYCEAFVPFVKELAVMVARGRDGKIAVYPVVETIQENHICILVLAPAGVEQGVAQRVVEQATAAVESIDGVGIFGVELFMTADGGVLLNEMAPRPHNSGHYTIEGCTTSQFENHIRAVMGWPLGATDLRAPAVVMANILGRRNESGVVATYPDILAHPQAHLHIYGKSESRTGRKMGHITLLAGTMDEALREAQAAEAAVEFGG
jgi:5-(carboxyamino)imidazole ribonucleotide synthase